MTHPDQDLLADLALGEPVDADAAAHAVSCPECAAELRSLRAALGVARAPRPEMVAAPGAVWDRVLADVATDEDDAHDATAADPPGAELVREPDEADVLPVSTRSDELSGRRVSASRRRVGLGWVAGAAAAGLVFGVVGARVVSEEQEPAAPVTIASTSLDTLDTLQARGTADLLTEDGRTDLVLHTEPLDADGGYLEVWLINRDLKRMVSVGVLRPGAEDQAFVVPQDLIDQGYVIVDISREGYDDKPQHSGDSVVRGTLPA